MAVSPVGGMIYTNQQAPAVSLMHQNVQMRSELQSFFAQELFKEKELEVQAVAEAKDSDAVEADREFLGEGEAQEREKKEKEERQPTKSEHSGGLHILDIKV